MPDRKYDEHEIARVIERAAELQEAAAERVRRSERGLTLSELERVGTETGLDPAFIRAAAAEADTPGPRAAERSGPSATHVVAERWVPGPLTPEVWEETVAALRRYATGSPGQTDRIGRAREWTGRTGAWFAVDAVVSPRGNGQRVRVRRQVAYANEAVEALAMIGPFFALFGAVFTGAATGSAVGALVGGLVVYMLAAVLGFVGNRAWRRAKQRDLDRLADEVEDALRAADDGRVWGGAEGAGDALPPEAAPPLDDEATPRPEGDRAGRIDLDALPDAAEGGVAVRRRDRA